MIFLVLFAFSCIFSSISNAAITGTDEKPVTFTKNLTEVCNLDENPCDFLNENINWANQVGGRLKINLEHDRESEADSGFTAVVTWNKKPPLNLDLEEEKEKCEVFKNSRYKVCLLPSKLKYSQRFNGNLIITVKLEDKQKDISSAESAPSSTEKPGSKVSESTQAPPKDSKDSTVSSTTQDPSKVSKDSSDVKEKEKSTGWSFMTFFWIFLAILLISLIGVVYYFRHVPMIADRLSLLRGGRI